MTDLSTQELLQQAFDEQVDETSNQEPIEQGTPTESTPVETEVAESNDTTSNNEPIEQPSIEEKIYAGKFKSIEDLEKSYQELEKYKSKLANEVNDYKKKATEYESKAKPDYSNEKTAKDVELLDSMIKDGSFGEYTRYANAALADYYTSKDPKFLKEVRDYLLGDQYETYLRKKIDIDSNIDKLVKQETEQRRLKKFEDNLREFTASNPDYLQDSYKQEVFARLKDYSDDIDLPTIKGLIDIVEEGVKAKYVKKIDNKQTMEESMINATPSVSNVVKEKPLTKKDLVGMSAADLLKNYDKIVNIK